MLLDPFTEINYGMLVDGPLSQPYQTLWSVRTSVHACACGLSNVFVSVSRIIGEMLLAVQVRHLNACQCKQRTYCLGCLPDPIKADQLRQFFVL